MSVPAGPETTVPAPAAAPNTVSTTARRRSALYEGTVHHRRFGPGPGNEFSYRVAMPLLDLAEVRAVTRRHPLWSARRPAPVWFRRSDFLGDPAVPLEESVRRLVEARTDRRPEGPIWLLANLRTWGWLFNPISVYFCADASGEWIDHVVCEVQNTPWHERHCYVVGPPGRHRFQKALHVSPFLPMDLDYVVSYTAPSERLVVRFDVLRGEDRVLEATLSLRRRELDRRSMGRLLWSYPAMTHRVSAGIYRQAARLRRLGAPVVAHPADDPNGVLGDRR